MKDIVIDINASEASGEAYWRKRCDVIEKALAARDAEIERLRSEKSDNERLGDAVRRIPSGVLLARGDAEWRVWRKATDYNSMSEGDTPEAAMIAAGLMKGEK